MRLRGSEGLNIVVYANMLVGLIHPFCLAKSWVVSDTTAKLYLVSALMHDSFLLSTTAWSSREFSWVKRDGTKVEGWK